jgi:hypothetical protein
MTSSASSTIAFVAKTGDKYACVIDGKAVAKSKHQDYFKYHHGKHDVKALERDISKFVYLDDAGAITYITDPAGVNAPDAALRRQAALAVKVASAH